jgi:dihydrolipoamide dehydrogenase
MKHFDVAIIGGGPGGYVAAIRASQLGLNTVLVEREHLGGVCLNWGCIPMKALLRSAEVFNHIKRAGSFGLSVDGLDFDLKKIVRRSRDISQQLNQGVGHLLEKNHVAVIDGYARLRGKGQVTVEKKSITPEQLSSHHIIIATGARAKVLPGLEPDGKMVLTYKEALVPDSVPKSLLIVGSGAIGMEFASFYHTFGARVTVVEMLPQILPLEDAEVSETVRKSMEKQGMDFYTGARLKELRRGKKSVATVIEKDGKDLEIIVDRVISAVGVSPNVEGIGLEDVGINLDKNGFIAVDEYFRTSIEGIYAIGDVCGGPCLAHKASREGIICVEKIAAKTGVSPLDKSKIPGCIYCNPQVARVGLTEMQARDRGHEIKVGRFPFAGNGKAIALGEPQGLVKTIFDAQTGELLGAHMVGHEVTEMIHGFGLARDLEATEEELMHTVFPHPTLSEMMQESVLNAFGRTLHF